MDDRSRPEARPFTSCYDPPCNRVPLFQFYPIFISEKKRKKKKSLTLVQKSVERIVAILEIRRFMIREIRAFATTFHHDRTHMCLVCIIP